MTSTVVPPSVTQPRPVPGRAAGTPDPETPTPPGAAAQPGVDSPAQPVADDGGSAGAATVWALRLSGPVDPAALRRALCAHLDPQAHPGGAESAPDGALPVAELPGPIGPDSEARALHGITNHGGTPWRRLLRVGDRLHLLVGAGGPMPVPELLAAGYAAEALESPAGTAHGASAVARPGSTVAGPPAQRQPESVRQPEPLPQNGSRPSPPGTTGSGLGVSELGASEAGAVDGVGYWGERLAGAARLDLFPDQPRPARTPYRAALASHLMPPTVAAAISALARDLVVAERSVLLAGLGAVLHRYTGEPDVTVATPVPGGTALLRLTEAEPSLARLAAAAESAWAGAAAHGPVPDALVTALAGGHPVASPLSLTVEPPERPTGRAAGLLFEWLAGGPTEVAEDIAVAVSSTADGVRCQVRYAADLFTPGRIAALLRHWERVLVAGCAEPERPVEQLAMLDEAERAALIALGDGAPAAYSEITMHAWVGEQMRRRPTAVAAICAGEQLTYGELERRSALLAGHLRQLGVGPGSVVAVVLSRGLHTLVAMLGVLRAGAAYTPIDPAFPAERITFVLNDTAAPVVLTVAGVLDDQPPVDGVAIRRLDADWPTIEAEQSTEPLPEVDPDALAYVLFTSGSTGTPKGVLLEHRMIVNYLTWMVGECGIDAQTRMLHTCSPVFDLAVGEIFSALVSGGCVVIATHEEVVSPGMLTRVIADNQVTHSFTPPTTLSLVDPAACDDLRLVLVAGEVVAPELIQRWLDRGARVMNLYGPAEATVSCTFFDCVPGTFGSSIPIGKVMPNRAARILDRHGNLVPVGVPGELLVAGLGVARGYLNRAELTAQRFGTDPYATDPHSPDPHPAAPAYRTGDLARWNAAGDIEFLGRADTQIKLNGLRIELGEIEAVLATHPDVAAAVVAVRTDHGPARLVGYTTGRDGRRPNGFDLREHAARVLPHYMVPAAFVTVDAFPLGATGKVNRAALPAPTPSRPQLRTPFRAPATPREEQVAAMVGEVLRIEGVGADDRFFDLGASSLDVARLCRGLAAVRGEAVPISQVYRQPTVAELASWLETPLVAVTAPQLADVDAPDGGVVLASGQANLVEVTERLVCPTTWWIEGDLDAPALVAALGDLHRRHQALYAHYRRTTPATALVPADPGDPEVHLLPAAPDDDAALVALDEVAQRPLVIGEGHVWRAVLCPSLHSGRTLLGIAIHHIAFDGWSQAIVVHDLAFAYTARRAGSAPEWAAPAPTLAEVAVESARGHAAADLPPQRAYWLDQLRTVPRLAIPGMTRGPLTEWGPKEGRSFRISAARVSAWDEYVRGAGMSRFGYLAGIFGQVLRGITGQADVAMMVPVARRGNEITDRSVGCRLDAICLRLRPDAGLLSGAAGDWLGAAGRTVHEALSAQDLPFSEVVMGLAAVRPDLHVLMTIPTFILQDNALPELPLPGCRTELVEDAYAKEVPTPLTVEVFPAGAGFTLRVTVRTDRIPVGVADRIGADFLALLDAGPPAAAG